jgi:Spy/CpxP family protein refolding chaperone
MLKKWILALALAGLVCSVAPVIAQDAAADQQAPAGGPEGGLRHFDPARRAEMLTKQLNLNSEQQAKVLDILKSSQSQMESLHSDTSTPPQGRRAKMREIHKNTSDQIRAVLDENQQKQWDAMQSRHEQWQGHGQGAPPDSSEQK